MQLASGTHIPDGLLAANVLLSEKPRHGVASKNPALNPGINEANSTVAIGLRAGLLLNRVESRYTGKERDQESGLDYFGARYYGSSMGRWMSPDPAGLTYADPGDPQSLNLYSYVLNNPLKFVDPTGMACVWDDGSFDSEDDKQTGNAGSCKGAGGTWLDKGATGSLSGGQDWSNKADSYIADAANFSSATVNAGSGSASPVLSTLSTLAYTLGWTRGMGFVAPNISYGPNSLGTQDMRRAGTVKNAIQRYRDAGCPSSGGPLGAGHFDAWKETASTMASGQINPTQAEVGGYSGSISPNSSGSMTMTINNTTGLASALGVSTYAPSLTGAVDAAGTLMGMPPVHQTFQWTEANPCHQ